MKKLLKDSMEEVGVKVEKVLRDRIDEDVYSAYNNPDMSYERTRELKNSVTHTHPKEEDGQIVVKVGHDTSLINPYSPNQHMSVEDGSDVSNYLPQWINDGTIGNIFGEGVWTKPRPYMDNTKEEIKNNNILEKELKKGLKKRGVNIE